MKSKNYLLTQDVEIKETRRVFPRRDANCPIIAHVRPRGREEHVGVASWMVNLCEDGCLITSDHFPNKVEDIYLTVPGIEAKVHGKSRAQGKYTINVKFTKLFKPDVVERIARIKTVPKS